MTSGMVRCAQGGEGTGSSVSTSGEASGDCRWGGVSSAETRAIFVVHPQLR